jgi:hypothetical protein
MKSSISRSAAGRRCPSGTIPSTAQRTARLVVLGFELANHSLGLIVEGGDDPRRGSLPRGEERRIARVRRARLCGIRSDHIGNGPIRPCNMRSDPT